MNELYSLTHLDGRNARKLGSLRSIFSEYAWMKQRYYVMVRYVICIYPHVSGKKLSPGKEKNLLNIYSTFDEHDALMVKEIESTVNHDLKAIEMYFISALEKYHLEEFVPYVNLGIGSEDVNNIAFAQALTEGIKVLQKELTGVAREIMILATEHSQTVMVARTHGLPANITTFGKEMGNVLLRLCEEYEIFSSVKLYVKCSGEVGSYQAQFAADQKIDWMNITDSFITSLGFGAHHGATQIAPYDCYGRLFHSIARINSICIDFVQNLWLYISIGFARVSPIVAEVGSAGMPHKVNPIYLEGAEGNLKMANMLFEGLARELPINRLQRSFTDSTMRRNVVLPLSFSLLSYQSIIEGLKRLVVEPGAIGKDLERHPEVWLESIKAFGIVHGILDIYDQLKKETRGRVLTGQTLSRIISQLSLTKSEKAELRQFCRQSKNPFPSRVVDEALKRTQEVFGL